MTGSTSFRRQTDKAAIFNRCDNTSFEFKYVHSCSLLKPEEAIPCFVKSTYRIEQLFLIGNQITPNVKDWRSLLLLLPTQLANSQSPIAESVELPRLSALLREELTTSTARRCSICSVQVYTPDWNVVIDSEAICRPAPAPTAAGQAPIRTTETEQDSSRWLAAN